VLTALALQLSQDLRQQAWAQALDAACHITDERWRTSALEALMCALPLSSADKYWQESLPVLSRRLRYELLADLRVLAPLLLAAGGNRLWQPSSKRLAMSLDGGHDPSIGSTKGTLPIIAVAEGQLVPLSKPRPTSLRLQRSRRQR
jgi:hypothetical protein